MYKIEINVHQKELFVKLVIYKDYNEMHGQKNIKFCELQMAVFIKVQRFWDVSQRGTANDGLLAS